MRVRVFGRSIDSLGMCFRSLKDSSFSYVYRPVARGIDVSAEKGGRGGGGGYKLQILYIIDGQWRIYSTATTTTTTRAVQVALYRHKIGQFISIRLFYRKQNR